DEEVEADPLDGLAPPKKRRMGPIDTIHIDLLGEDETSVLWLGTHKGVPFLQAAEADYAVFLWQHKCMCWDADGVGCEVCGDKTKPMYRVATMAVKGNKAGGW